MNEKDWGDLRGACARKAWREAWEIVGTDHEGEPTPGEIYIFGAARQVRSVAAALQHWYRVSLSWSGFGGRDQTWKPRYERIKTIARWESKAAAQFVEQPKVKKSSGHTYSLTLNGQQLNISVPDQGLIQAHPVTGRVVNGVVVDDPVQPAQDIVTRAVIDGELRVFVGQPMIQETLSALDRTLEDLRRANLEYAEPVNPFPRGPVQRKRRSR